MSAFYNSLPIIGGVAVPGGGIWMFINYIIKQLTNRASTAEKALAISEQSELEQRNARYAADAEAAKYKAMAIGLTQTVSDMHEQLARAIAENIRLRGDHP
jgi:hypothetical protein